MTLRGSSVSLLPVTHVTLGSAQPFFAIHSQTATAMMLPAVSLILLCSQRCFQFTANKLSYFYISAAAVSSGLRKHKLTFYNENILHVRACFIRRNYQRTWTVSGLYVHLSSLHMRHAASDANSQYDGPKTRNSLSAVSVLPVSLVYTSYSTDRQTDCLLNMAGGVRGRSTCIAYRIPL